MFKILMLLTLQFCVHRGEFKYLAKAPDNKELEMEMLCPDRGKFFLDKFKRVLGEKVGDTQEIRSWKNGEQRNWLSCYLIYALHPYHIDSIATRSTIELLEYLIPIMKDNLLDKDIYGCNFMHYLVMFVASLPDKSAEEQILSTLKKILGKDMKSFDCKDSYGVTQLFLSEILNMNMLAKFIKESNKPAIYNDHKKLMKQHRDRLDWVATKEEEAKQVGWEPVESFKFLLNEIINKENPDWEAKPTDIVAYSTMFLDTNLKNLLYRNVLRRRKYKSSWWEGVKLYLSAAEERKILEQASRDGCSSVVRDLLKRGIDVKSWHSLIGAAVGGNVEIIKMLLEAGADIEGATEILDRDCTPLYFAAVKGNVGAAYALIEAGANINDPNILLAAAGPTRGSVEILWRLIHLGANIKTSNLLINLINVECEEAAIEMLEKGAQVDGHCLYKAAREGLTRLVRAILKKGVDPNYLHKSNYGKELQSTPLFEAAVRGHCAVVKDLLDAKADPNLYVDLSKVPLYRVEDLIRNQANNSESEEEGGDDVSKLLEIKEMLIKGGATYNDPDKDGVLPLHKAAQSSDYFMRDVIQSILDSGVDVDCVDKYGKTALYYAGISFQLANFLVLGRNGASWDQAVKLGWDITKLSEKGGRAMIHMLAENGYFTLILNKNLGKDKLNTISRNGKTILNYAVTSGVSLDIIDRMIDSGCRLDLREKGTEDEPGRLVIEIALRSRNWKTFKRLYTRMKDDSQASKLLKSQDLKYEIEQRATKNVKDFIAEEEAKSAKKGKGKKRKAGDDNDASKKEAPPKRGLKRKADDAEGKKGKKQ